VPPCQHVCGVGGIPVRVFRQQRRHDDAADESAFDLGSSRTMSRAFLSSRKRLVHHVLWQGRVSTQVELVAITCAQCADSSGAMPYLKAEAPSDVAKVLKEAEAQADDCWSALQIRARDIVAAHPEVADATCILVSRIGWPVETPQVIELQIRTRADLPLEAIRERVQATAPDGMRGISRLPQLLLERASIESQAMWPEVRLF
jgi:hypothetical protein